MKVTGIQTQSVEIEVSKIELHYTLIRLVMKIAELGEDYDDAGCDWLTKDGNTYIANSDWRISSSIDVATLVDAANIILYGEPLHLDE